LLTAEFDFDLPEAAIAQRPAPRGQARLLVLDAPDFGAGGRHRQVRDLPSLLREGDLVIVNDTRVIPARLYGTGPGGGRVEILLVERVDSAEAADGRTWTALVKPGRKARPGARVDFAGGPGATFVAGPQHADGRRTVRFDEPIEPHLERIGHLPLPPYIRRAADGSSDELEDRAAYQTVFAREPGAIAAPTAGLHFSHELLDGVRTAGAEIASITLHVGIGTFKPMTAELVHEHVMHAERFEIPRATAQAIEDAKARGGRVIAVGTTVVRCLEGAALLGGGKPLAGAGSTRIFITPGHRFLVVDALLTNFHLPQSTLLLLVSAFAGRSRVLAAYREAIDAGYRFFSYGDAMFCERRDFVDQAEAMR
jgi:S-adenosylmethionine:tRNA ribosyltransferase-isomerase